MSADASERLAAQVASVQAGHLAAQKAMHLVREGEHPDVIELARRSLGNDTDALAAFARSLARGREA